MDKLKEKVKNIPLRITTIIGIVLVLIAIIVPSVITIRRFGRLEDYEKLVLKIEKATKKWIDENNIHEPKHITVNYLVENGYLEADNDLGEVINPKNENSALNCNTIFIDFHNTETEITYNEEKDCDLMKTELIDAKIVGITDGNQIESDSLVSDDITLEIIGNDKCKKITWYIDGVEVAEYRNAISIPVTYKEHVKETYSAKCETEEGIVLLKYILRTERVVRNQQN